MDADQMPFPSSRRLGGTGAARNNAMSLGWNATATKALLILRRIDRPAGVGTASPATRGVPDATILP
jgi:hypothetical protein